MEAGVQQAKSRYQESSKFFFGLIPVPDFLNFHNKVVSFDQFDYPLRGLDLDKESFDGISLDARGVIHQVYSFSHSLNFGSESRSDVFRWTGHLGPWAVALDTNGNFKTDLQYGWGNRVWEAMAAFTFQSNPNAEYATGINMRYVDKFGAVSLAYHSAENVIASEIAFRIRPSICLGTSLVALPKQGAITPTAIGIQHAGETGITHGILHPAGLEIGHYHVATEQVAIGTTIAYPFVNPQGGATPPPRLTLGAELAFRASRVRTTFDSNYRLITIMEESFNTTTKASLCFNLDHWNQKYSFGLSLSVQV
eukprot:TRINITY_DN21361_c0_g1_i1.p1 TRINITY_DN21361_c0_g1~~TRINITY_DN21361_c0_g1_i1.p1  ORF type:complete len:309 (-),score=42.50 TRINITY_DN21361_c0_g1_i1:267-1193(-)